LTVADAHLDEAARELRSRSSDNVDFAERACAWSRAALTYGFGVTGVRTTASEALAGGVGVCQDYAHIMLALCRAVGVPARYVSGHLLGEGGSHAWVEVIASDPSGAIAVAFDPTHDRRAVDGYLTVALGREYTDVAPTSGSFRGEDTGLLTASKSLRVLDRAPA
jgi:transglutaminase-like putative cysteine protease